MRAGPPCINTACIPASKISFLVAPCFTASWVCKAIHHSHCAATAKATLIRALCLASIAPDASVIVANFKNVSISTGTSFLIFQLILQFL